MSTYEEIRDSVDFGFEEYVGNYKYNTAQAFCENSRGRLVVHFSRTAFFVCLALESLKKNEVADFILLKLNTFLGNLEFKNYIKIDDVKQLLHDISMYKERITRDDYNIIHTDETWKGRLEYILSLKQEDL